MSTVIDPILPREGMRPPQHLPLLVLLCAAGTGVVIDRYWPIAFAWWWLTAGSALLLWLALFLAKRQRLAVGFLLIATMALFAGWHHTAWNLYRVDEIGRRATLDVRPALIEATAVTNVRWRPAPKADPLRAIPQGDTCRCLVQACAIRDGDVWRPASGRAMLIVEGHLVGIRAGDRLRLHVLISRVPPAANPGEFDSAYHERVDRQLVRLSADSPDCVARLQSGSSFDYRRWLSSLRDVCSEQLWQQIAPERAGLASGLLIGAREQIEYEQQQQFFLTGTIHLLAISGVHVGILTWGFWLFMRTGILGRRSAIVAAIAFVWVYTLLADMEPPIVRSAILVSVICFGRWLGRPTPPMNALAAGGLVVLALNPTELFQVGTQLSFLAVATLIACGPLLVMKRTADPLRRLIEESRPWPQRWARFAVSYTWRLWLTGACVWLVALPLTLYRFHVLSLSALVLNLLVWIPITIAMYAGFAALTIGWVVPPLGPVLGWICDASLCVVADCIRIGEAMPFSYTWVAGPALWWTLVFYAALAAYAAFPAWRPPQHWSLALLALWVAVGFATAERSIARDLIGEERPLRCTFVAVGHGTSVIVELPSGQTLLYDAGHMGTPKGVADSVSSVLWSRGISRIDAVVISHADSDHYNGLPELLNRFEVGSVYVSPVMFHEEPPGVRAVHDALIKHHIPLHTLHGGQRLVLGSGVTCEALHPPRRGVIGSDNANSIVLLLEYSGQRILLPGDLERNGLADVLAEEPIACSIVMAPHHGSASSNPRGFADWTSPRWVALSGARSRDATEVIDAYRSYGAEVLQTSHDGALRFTISKRGDLTVETWHNDAWHPRVHRDGR